MRWSTTRSLIAKGPLENGQLFVTDPETGEIMRQFSLQRGATEFDRQLNQLGPGEAPSSTLQADRNPFLNAGGANQHFDIGLPSGMAPKAFAEGIIRSGDFAQALGPFSLPAYIACGGLPSASHPFERAATNFAKFRGGFWP